LRSSGSGLHFQDADIFGTMAIDTRKVARWPRETGSANPDVVTILGAMFAAVLLSH